ncbi:MAG: hydroxyacylglutathione hydrolase [Planctomycetota bacterium]
MIVERVWVGNALRNYNYLVACGQTGEALLIDPLDHRACLRLARERGYEVTQVLNTHEHRDHVGGNDRVVAATGAAVVAHHRAQIAGVDRRVGAGDVVRVGATVALECMDTPGHTMSHVCLLARGPEAALFSGDTLFNAGAGNCHNGGHPEVLYETFSRQLARLDDDVRLYPGHDYLVGNLRFTLDREPDNAAAAAQLTAVAGRDGDAAPVLTIGQERAVNTFFRLDSPGVRAGLRRAFDGLSAALDEREVFLLLRELRNRW